MVLINLIFLWVLITQQYVDESLREAGIFHLAFSKKTPQLCFWFFLFFFIQCLRPRGVCTINFTLFLHKSKHPLSQYAHTTHFLFFVLFYVLTRGTRKAQNVFLFFFSQMFSVLPNGNYVNLIFSLFPSSLFLPKRWCAVNLLRPIFTHHVWGQSGGEFGWGGTSVTH